MSTDFCYDFSGFSGSLFQGGPTGIARVDLEGARFFSTEQGAHTVGYHQLFRIHTRFSAQQLARMVGHVDRAWNEFADPQRKAGIEAWLDGGSRPPRLIGKFQQQTYLQKAACLISKWPWHNLTSSLPDGSCYVNLSYANTRRQEALAWLSRRKNVNSLFMIHDLLPLHKPEWFWDGLSYQFNRQVDCIFSLARGIITPSQVVANDVRLLLAKKGIRSIPVSAIHLPASDVFSRRSSIEKKKRNYFVICGTIEPRKNHKLLLEVWKTLAQRNSNVPKLLVFGKRGWKNDSIVRMLDHDEKLRAHCLEISDISTNDLAFFVRGARALLIPSFDEGFGLPLIEALAAGTKVIASNIPVFREISHGQGVFIDLDNTNAWVSEIEECAHSDYGSIDIHGVKFDGYTKNWNSFFGSVAKFAREL